MNSYIEAQILNMITLTKTFEQACELAALKNDHTISKEEQKALNEIKKASAGFRKQLSKIK